MRSSNEKARVHHAAWRCGGMADCGAGEAGARSPKSRFCLCGLRCGGSCSYRCYPERLARFGLPSSPVEIVARTAEGDPAQIGPLVAEVIAKNVNVFIVNGPV